MAPATGHHRRSAAVSDSVVCGDDGLDEARWPRFTVGSPSVEVGRAVAVGRPEARDRVAVDPGHNRALGVEAAGVNHSLDGRGRVTEQVVHVPVTGVPLAGREFPVAVDPGEPTGPEGTPRVGEEAGGKLAGAEGADVDGRGVLEPDGRV